MPTMALPPPEISPLSVLGFTADREELYRVVLRNSGCSVDDLGTLTARPRRSVEEEIGPLVAAGLVDVHDGTVLALPP